jgi:hypothetical protein
MAGVGYGEARLHIERHNAHLAHQTADLAATDVMAPCTQFITDISAAPRTDGPDGFHRSAAATPVPLG